MRLKSLLVLVNSFLVTPKQFFELSAEWASIKLFSSISQVLSAGHVNLIFDGPRQTL